MTSVTIGIKIDDSLRARIKDAAARQGRTSHGLIKQAVIDCVERIERDAALPPVPGGDGVATRSLTMAEAAADAPPSNAAPTPFLDWAQSVLPQTELRAAITAAWHRPEPDCLPALVQAAQVADPAQRDAIRALATRLVEGLRASRASGGVEALVQEFSLSSQEGVALMCLAEALLRIPDNATRDALIRDKISRGDWQAHLGHSPSLFVNAAVWGLMLTGKLTATASEKNLASALTRLIGKGGEPLIRQGVHRAMKLMGEQFVTGQTIAEALANSRAVGEEGLPLFVRHARRGGHHRGRRGEVPRRLRAGDPRDRQGLARARHLRRAGDLGQALGAAPALRPGPARARDGRAAAAAGRTRRAGAPLRHRPQHRRRGGRPPGAVARPARGAVLRPGAEGLERHRLRRPGLPEALPGGDRPPRRPGAAQRPPADDPPRQGRVLGQRDQARPARRSGRLPGLHAQGPHRRGLPRLRAQAARRAGRGLPAVRHAQRADGGRHPPAGGCELLRRPVRIPVPARHGRAAVRAGHRRGQRRQAGPALPDLRAGRHARDAARLPGAPAARERRQHLVRQPHRRPRRAGGRAGAGPGRTGASDRGRGRRRSARRTRRSRCRASSSPRSARSRG